MTVDTARLQLIPVTEAHTAFIFMYFTDEITRYMVPDASKTMEETREIVRRFIRERKSQTDYVWAITLKKSGEFLGLVGLHSMGDPIPELGVWTKKEAHGCHYGREAIGGVIAYARTIGIHKLRYPVDRRNTPSRKIPLFYGGHLVTAAHEVKTPGGRILQEEIYEIPLIP